ncbi:MAG: L-rhamnose isomerase [Bacteroidetes bacterium GWE2_41_25]|nr:MAG: L-rhamnose isomerase [Bacteroidetes bacterium GWA2_40_15]OFX93781.1 MAG: L-rhamnose isomerase [Bacteroidetes bacterium GWE2_41_25]OFX98609.1 MAG: L-rhamnose isomerase [Bacteroidetes bacterium GWC2_40_22]OFY58511.1 MAG: L-rhamnose isomerase [Bacteroidetes bacterium GWF2_41_9]HAM09699.1 L-rhamnose isomerase [Bacteroidales bacterium]
MKKELIKKSYDLAKEQYASLGVDTDLVIKEMEKVNISLHCWQTDDVGGYEKPGAELGGGGIQVTGNFPGKAKTIEQMRADLDKVMSLLPGKQRLNLHAIYGEFGGKQVDRDKIEVKHFQGWINWAKKRGMGLDFNCTCFSHPLADDGFTLSSKNERIRKFWVEHTKRCRLIAAEMGKQLGTPSVHNIWIPDGSKDTPVDRNGLRKHLKKSLDEVFAVKYPKKYLKDSVESKLFGIGSEAMVVGSHDFYLGYAIKNNILITLDNGHFHPTEQVGDKVSSILHFVDEVLLHLTRGIRWDSDHVLTFNEELVLIAQEIVRCKALGRVYVGLDFFDASLNRIGAYVIGTRAAQMAFMYALLEPHKTLLKLEEQVKGFERLALLELLKSKPFGAVWDYYCLLSKVPVAEEYIEEIGKYEKDVLLKR